MDVIAVFDIGKTSRKFLLYDTGLSPVLQEVSIFGDGSGDDGFAGDNVIELASWIRSCISAVITNRDYTLRALNYTWYTDWPLFPDNDRNSSYNNRKISSALRLPVTLEKSALFDAEFDGRIIKTGGGLNDKSAMLMPFFAASAEQFILVSAGTWCIFMNPFNTEPLTPEQLGKDTVCYTGINGRQVKSSRFFLGHIHDMNVTRLDDYFGVTEGHYKTIKIKSKKISRLLAGRHGRIFFRHGIPPGYTDNEPDLSQFLTYADAYHQMVCDLVDVSLESYRLIIPADDMTEVVYIAGGFARNDTFVRILAARLPDKRVFTTDIENPSALGAALVIYEDALGLRLPHIYLGLRAIIDNQV